MKTKFCKGCKRDLPLTVEYFQARIYHHKDGSKTNGFISRCRECKKKSNAQYFQDHKYKAKYYWRTYSGKNKKTLLKGQRDRYNALRPPKDKPKCELVWKYYLKCPWISCPHHTLHLHKRVLNDYTPITDILDFLENELTETCSLRLIAKDGMSFHSISRSVSMTPQGVHKIYQNAIKKINHPKRLQLLEDWA